MLTVLLTKWRNGVRSFIACERPGMLSSQQCVLPDPKQSFLTMLMMKTFLLFAALAVADGATTVAVLEFGKQGCVRRTTATNTRTTVAGANSFFRALSGKGLQQSGMTVVPDLFNKPDGMVVVGISGSGVDLNSMPILSNLVQSEGNGVVGHMTLPEAHHRHLMNHVGPSKSLDTASFVDGVKAEASSKKLSSVSIDVDVGNSGAVDAQIAAMISALQKQAGSDSTIIVHLVVEEEDGAFRRRLSENGGAEDNQSKSIMKCICVPKIDMHEKLTFLFCRPTQSPR